jgi:hypothetical protein
MKHKKPDRLKDWKDQIAVLFLVQNEIQRHDELGVWQYYYPELAATEEQLVTTERYLGHSIDKDYRDFLLCANGWSGFFQSVTLFGTGDLMGSKLMYDAMETLGILDDGNVLKASGFTKAELLPIAATLFDKDLFVIARPTSSQPGMVIWFAGEEIDRYPNFKEYFLSMTDYNRLEIENFKKYNEERKRKLKQDAIRNRR